MKPLRCLQVNLQHKRAATNNLVQTMSENQIELAFVQEPYIIRIRSYVKAVLGYRVSILNTYIQRVISSSQNTTIKIISYMMEVASNYMFRPLWWPSSGCTSKRKSK